MDERSEDDALRRVAREEMDRRAMGESLEAARREESIDGEDGEQEGLPGKNRNSQKRSHSSSHTSLSPAKRVDLV